MATFRYFNGETELKNVQPMDNRDFAARFPGVVGKRYDSFSKWVGQPVTGGALVPVERSIEWRGGTSGRHECDARCLNATGRTMKCECKCGGKNHGRGAFFCETAA